MHPLTLKQRAVFDFVVKELAHTGHAPTFASIALAFGFASKQSVTGHVAPLIAKGYLCHGPGGTLAVPGLAEHLAPFAREYLSRFAPTESAVPS